jgi:putative effector of murein hydrolase
LGTISVESTTSVAPLGGAAKKTFEESTEKFLIVGAIVSAAVSIMATKTGNSFQKPLETLFLGFTTLASYVWGANLPTGFTKIVNPLVSSAVVTLGVARLTGLATATSFLDVLRSYTCKQLVPMEAGAGDLLLFLLSPTVISFAIGMYKGKSLIAANLPAIFTAVSTGSIGSMFGTAFFARLIQLGGPEGQIIRLAAIPRSTQTALGMLIAGMLGGDIAIAATIIILTGIFGGMVGVKTLNAWGVKDSVSRGLGIGSAGLALGTVSIKGEQEAFAFAGLCLVLTAVAATCLASVPAVSDLLIQIAGGAPKIVDAAASAAV